MSELGLADLAAKDQEKPSTQEHQSRRQPLVNMTRQQTLQDEQEIKEDQLASDESGETPVNFDGQQHSR